MAKLTQRQQKALSALNLDLFEPDTIQVPAPATLDTKIRESAGPSLLPGEEPEGQVARTELPSEAELYRLFDRFNWMYFSGKLKKPKIEYSNRMTTAGVYYPGERLIRIGRKYHEVFPEEITDTLKHEMIHLIHYRHDAAFKAEAARIGASLKARSHPSLNRPARYIYECPGCGLEYPRQKRLVMASCGRCSRRGRYDKRFKLQLKYSRKRAS